MAMTQPEYLSQLQALLPTGAAWPRDPDANLTQFLAALADELARLDARGVRLLDETDPRSTFELLADWEQVAGLPEPCREIGTTIQERRGALHARLTQRGIQSRQFYIDLAAAMGYEIHINEYRPFRAGISRAGDMLTNDAWRYRFMVRTDQTTTTFDFKAGQSVAGEPLRRWGASELECTLRQYKPAHTDIGFAYGI